MNTRRKLLLAFGASSLLAGFPVFAQERRLRKIAYLGGGTLENDAPWLAAFRGGLAQLGWVEGRDYVLDARFANSVAAAQPPLASELIATQPEVILAPADGATAMLFARTKTIPIVFAQGLDPIGLGVAASLRRPGANVTGLTSLVRELGPKRMQLLKEAFPGVASVGVLSDTSRYGLVQVKEIEEATKILGMRVHLLEINKVEEIESAFKRGATQGVHAYTATTGIITINQRPKIIDMVARSRLPAIYPISVFADSGGLFSYGISTLDNFRRAAGYVDKILKGANPGELPIEQPTKLELVVNMKTARAMKLTIPQAILLRADRVIE